MNKTVKGLNINYFEYGEGPLVVLLHGWGSNISLFSCVAELIAQKYKVVAMDMPGFGKSDEPKEIWDVDAYTDFVIEFLNDYNDEEIIFMGHSFGGRVIIKMFERDNLPFKISKLILTGSAGIVPEKSKKQKIREGIFRFTRKIYTSKPFEKVFSGVIESMRKSVGSADYNAASATMRKILIKVVNEDLRHIFPKVTPPTLLIWGRNDTATPVKDGEMMEKSMQNAKLYILENSGHYTFLDEMFEFNRLIKRFLNIWKDI